MPKERTIQERFERHVIKTENCWLWIGWKDVCGYGVMQFGGKKNGVVGKIKKAHRVSYEHTYGPFDKSLYVCHKCDNPACVRPDHLFLGTQKDNMQDMTKKGRRKGGFDATNNMLTKSKNFVIKTPTGEVIRGFNLSEFCRANNLTYACINDVIAGRAKAHRGYTRFQT